MAVFEKRFLFWALIHVIYMRYKSRKARLNDDDDAQTTHFCLHRIIWFFLRTLFVYLREWLYIWCLCLCVCFVGVSYIYILSILIDLMNPICFNRLSKSLRRQKCKHSSCSSNSFFPYIFSLFLFVLKYVHSLLLLCLCSLITILLLLLMMLFAGWCSSCAPPYTTIHIPDSIRRNG